MEEKKNKKNVETNEEPEVVVVEKSNRSLYVVIMLLVFGLGLCIGYIITSGLGANTLNNTGIESSSTNATESTNETKSLIKEAGKELIYVENGVPTFNINSTAAESANAEIKEFLESRSEGCLKSYKTYQYKDTLTIVTSTYCDGGSQNFFPYTIDSKTGNTLTNSEIIKIYNPNITDAEFVEKLVDAYKSINDAKNLSESSKDTYNSNLRELYGADINKYKIFINSNGELVVITELVPPAGPGEKNYALNIDKMIEEEVKSQ